MPLLSFFHNPKKERVLFFALCVVSVGLTLFRYVSKSFNSVSLEDKQQLVAEYYRLRDSLDRVSVNTSEFELIPPPKGWFDPNSASESVLQSIGLPTVICSNWTKYLQAGGRFKNPQDVGKIYGIQPFMESLLPIMKVPRSTANTKKNQVSDPRKSISYDVTKNLDPVDINSCSSLDLERLPGIGPVLATRIVKFRQAVGGFYDIRQVAETYGLPDETFQIIQSLIKIDPNKIKTINLNEVSAFNLQLHPYANRDQANLIVAFRKQHGKFEQVNDLKTIHGIDSVQLNKLMRYLVLN